MPDDSVQISIEAVDNASGTIEAVADKLGTIDDATKKAGGGLDDMGNSVDNAKSRFMSFNLTLSDIQAGVGLAQGALAGLKQVWEFGKEGAENQRIAESFSRTAKSIGADADEIVKKLDDAARGTVDDEELMQASTRALTLGVAKSGDDLVNVMKLARAAALQFGGDAGQAFETINYAIGNLAPRALKQFGIIVDLKDASEAYAKANGLVASSLTETEQRQALLNAVLEQGKKNFGDLADSATTTAEKMKAAETRIANVIDVVKELAATGINTAFTISDAPKNALEAFTATAEKMKAEVIAGRMSVKDYNDGLRGMADALSGATGGAIADATYGVYKLSEAFADSTKGAYGIAGALDESNRAARREADAAELAARQQALLAEAQRAATSGAYGLNGALDESERALMRTKEATKNAADSLARANDIMGALKTAMGGQLQNEFESFNNKQDDLAEKAKKVKEELDKLEAAQGRAVTSTKKHGLSANEAALAQIQLAKAQQELTSETNKGTVSAERAAALEETIRINREKLDGVTKSQISGNKQLTAASEALKNAQAELNNNTNPEKQLELAIKVDNLKEKLGQAAGAVTTYVDNSKKIGELRGQYDEINKEIEANAQAHEEATRRILFSYAEQSIAQENQRRGISALTEDQAKALDKLALQWGLKSQADIDAMQAIRDATAQLAQDNNIDGYVDRLTGNLVKVEAPLQTTNQTLQDIAKSHGALGILEPPEIKVTADLTPAMKASENFQATLRNQPPVEIKATIKTVTVEDIKAVAGDSMAERRAQIERTTGAATDATKTLTDATGKSVNAMSDAFDRASGRIKSAADVTEARANTMAANILFKMGNVASSVVTAFSNMGTMAAGDLSDITLMVEHLPTFKEFIYKITVKGEIPSGIPGTGAQYGADYIVPPNPRGGSGDYFPVIAAPGERVIVQTKAQQAQGAGGAKGGDTIIYNYNTSVTDTLAATMLMDQQRRERLARSNARMGVR